VKEENFSQTPLYQLTHEIAIVSEAFEKHAAEEADTLIRG
jgi:hypothetical protein